MLRNTCAPSLMLAGALLATAALGQQPPAGAPAPQNPLTPPVAPRTITATIPPTVNITPKPGAQDVPAQPPLSADEAAKIALRLQPNIASAVAAVQAAAGRTQQARSGLLPQVALSAAYNNLTNISIPNATTVTTPGGTGNTGGTVSNTTLSNNLSAGTSSTGFLATAEVRQLIFDFNHTRETVRQEESLQQAAVHDLTRTRNDTVFIVKQAFYQYVQAQRAVTVNQDDVKNRQAQLDLAQARLKSGLGLPSDVATAETSLAEGIADLTVAQNGETVARIDLALMMGIDPRTPISTAQADEPQFTSNDLTALVTLGEKQRPEVLEALANVAANTHGLSAARTTNAPVLAGVAGITDRGTDFPPTYSDLAIGATLNFTPFDGGFTRGKVNEARGLLGQAQAALASARLTVTSDVAQAYTNLRTGEQRVATANIEVTNGREGLRIAQGRYRAGLGEFVDIITAETQLLTAQTDLVNAQFAVSQGRAAIQHAIGAPLGGTR